MIIEKNTRKIKKKGSSSNQADWWLFDLRSLNCLDPKTKLKNFKSVKILSKKVSKIKKKGTLKKCLQNSQKNEDLFKKRAWVVWRTILTSYFLFNLPSKTVGGKFKSLLFWTIATVFTQVQYLSKKLKSFFAVVKISIGEHYVKK